MKICMCGAFSVFLLASYPASCLASVSGSAPSIDGAGRNVMRTADGGLVAALAVERAGASGLVFRRSLDNGKSWSEIAIAGAERDIGQVAVDSNFNGSYIAFTTSSGAGDTGRIAYFSSPFASEASYDVSPPVTPTGIDAKDTFIQASRAGWGDRASEDRQTVVYGWQDGKSKALYIGVSLDGKTFPVARRVVDDPNATSGPAVAIRGQFVIATYQTTNPALVPADVPEQQRAGRAYPAWVESHDGGRTWSKPLPLFGSAAKDFPMAQVEARAGEHRMVRLAGGTALPNSPILNWSSSASDRRFFAGIDGDKTTPLINVRPLKPTLRLQEMVDELGGTTFVQSSMIAVDVDGQPGEVSIVSFRPIEEHAEWTHVIANNHLTTLETSPRVDAAVSNLDAITSQFQYSALIDTAVRATIYKELDVKTREARIVAAVSTNTGKTFERHVSFTEAQLGELGIKDFNEATVFAASQCLYEDRDGAVFADMIVATDEGMHYARIPIGVNAAELRATAQ